MRQLANLIAALLLLVLVSGCASTQAYFVDRGHDALDVFT
jgi:predicted component of type VI protein secretion system